MEMSKEMFAAFEEIQMPRTPFALEKLVVGARFTQEQQYAQCVLELSIAYFNLQSAKLRVEQKEIAISEVKTEGRKGEIERELLRLEQEQTKLAMIGALREFSVLYDLWQKFPKKFTREELNEASKQEYQAQLETQANQDLNFHGRVSVGNQEGLRQLKNSLSPNLAFFRETEETEQRFLESSTPAEETQVSRIQGNYLKKGKGRILVGVPTREKAGSGLPCLLGVEFPSGIEHKIYNCWGRSVADAYNDIAKTAIHDDADFIFTVEDDTFPPPDALVRLLDLARQNPGCAVGGWYPKKEVTLQGVHIVLKEIGPEGKPIRGPLSADGQVHEVYTLAMGCSLFPVEMFRKIKYPWFVTTEHLSQDSFFSQLAREAGYKLLVDTSIKCRHIDVRTGKVYE